MNTLHVLNIIAEKNNDIKAFTFHSFPKQEFIQKQILDWGCCEEEHFKLAMQVRDELHLPFWDSVMVTSFNNPNYSKSILKIALRHNHPQSMIYINTEEIQHSPLLYDSNEPIAVCSSVLMRDMHVKHIPMLDFHIPISDYNLKIVENICEILELGAGYILNSGESYHFIGLRIVAWEELYLILSRALRFCPIIDRAWISHQLEENSCSLRVCRKNSIEPIVIRTID